MGSSLGLIYVIQLISGILLACHYNANIEGAFLCLQEITREIPNGYFLRTLHANGASAFFFAVYIHIGRSFYYGGFFNGPVWLSGILLLVVMMAIAFLGYVLPWGQMSFWGATVITSFFSSIPYVGNTLTMWIWGGYSVGGPTLIRFYALHFLLPFILGGLIVMHIWLLHKEGSSNPINSFINSCKIPFGPYFIRKDLLMFIIVWWLLSFVVTFYPWIFGEAENFIRASLLVTPEHIVPEWYFLFAYAILRCIPNKSVGLMGLVFSIAVLSILPLLYTIQTEGSTFFPVSRVIFWVMITNFTLLTWLGAQEVEWPFIIIAQLCSFYYFFHFILVNPFVRKTEYNVVFK